MEFRPVQSTVVPLQLWEGCVCLTVISWTGILWHHTHEKQTPCAPATFICLQLHKPTAHSELPGKQVFHSKATVIRSQQQLYATRPPRGWGLRSGWGGGLRFLALCAVAEANRTRLWCRNFSTSLPNNFWTATPCPRRGLGHTCAPALLVRREQGGGGGGTQSQMCFGQGVSLLL